MAVDVKWVEDRPLRKSEFGLRNEGNYVAIRPILQELEKLKMKSIWRSVITVIMFMLLSSPAAAQTSELTAAAVEDWADALFEQAMEEKRYSGAVVSLVQGGEITPWHRGLAMHG